MLRQHCIQCLLSWLSLPQDASGVKENYTECKLVCAVNTRCSKKFHIWTVSMLTEDLCYSWPAQGTATAEHNLVSAVHEGNIADSRPAGGLCEQQEGRHQPEGGGWTPPQPLPASAPQTHPGHQLHLSSPGVACPTDHTQLYAHFPGTPKAKAALRHLHVNLRYKSCSMFELSNQLLVDTIARHRQHKVWPQGTCQSSPPDAILTGQLDGLTAAGFLVSPAPELRSLSCQRQPR